MEDSIDTGERGAFNIAALDEGLVLGNERVQSGNVAYEGQRGANCLAYVVLCDLGSLALLVVVRVALHVELAESLKLIDLFLELRDAINLLLLLRVQLRFTLASALVKLLILVQLLAQVSGLLALSVEEKVVKLTEVELDGLTLLLFVLLLTGSCYLSAHIVVDF